MIDQVNESLQKTEEVKTMKYIVTKIQMFRTTVEANSKEEAERLAEENEEDYEWWDGGYIEFDADGHAEVVHDCVYIAKTPEESNIKLVKAEDNAETGGSAKANLK